MISGVSGAAPAGRLAAASPEAALLLPEVVADGHAHVVHGKHVVRARHCHDRGPVPPADGDCLVPAGGRLAYAGFDVYDYQTPLAAQ